MSISDINVERGFGQILPIVIYTTFTMTLPVGGLNTLGQNVDVGELSQSNKPNFDWYNGGVVLSGRQSR